MEYTDSGAPGVLRSIMERLYKKLNLLDFIIWLFISNHIGLIFLSYVYAPFTVLYVQNVLGIAYYLMMMILYRRKVIITDQCVLLCVIAIWVQQIISFLALGMGAGFQISSFITLCCCFFLMYHTRSRISESVVPIVIEIVSVVLYLGSMLVSRVSQPWYIVDEKVLNTFTTYNSVSSLLQILVFTDVFKNRVDKSVGQLQRQADVDELTELLNRHGIRTILDGASTQWKSNAIPFAVAIYDIDDFKQVNDTYGHTAGDEVLKYVASRLTLFRSDISAVCRWGGEEFMVVSQIPTNLGLFYDALNRVRSQIEEHEFLFGGETVRVTVTCGVAVIESDMPVHELINKADHRLYAGKANGKNQVVMFD